MNRTLRERYKYGSLEPFSAVPPGRLEVDLDLEAVDCLVERNSVAPPELPSGWEDDPLLLENLSQKEAEQVQITIPGHTVASGILYLQAHYRGSGRATLRNHIRVKAGAEARIVLHHHPCESPESIINSLNVIHLERGAKLTWVEVADSHATLACSTLLSQEGESRAQLTTFDLENNLLRRNQVVTLGEPKAHCQLGGLYLTAAAEYADNHVDIRHQSPDCSSDQLFKGVVSGTSKGVFTGHILVATDAQQTQALQQNHAILLSDRARVHTRPQLEIYADDVRCNHGASVGQLDPEARYYLRQRGIPPKEAERLQLEGFVNEVIDRSGLEEFHHAIREKIIRRLSTL